MNNPILAAWRHMLATRTKKPKCIDMDAIIQSVLDKQFGPVQEVK